MQNRQKEVEKRKTYIPLKIYHQFGAPGARAPYVTKSISSQIRNPNLYLGKVSERQLAQIISVYLAHENIEGGLIQPPLARDRVKSTALYYLSVSSSVSSVFGLTDLVLSAMFLPNVSYGNINAQSAEVKPTAA